MLQNLLYFWNMKILVIFFHITKLWQNLKRFTRSFNFRINYLFLKNVSYYTTFKYILVLYLFLQVLALIPVYLLQICYGMNTGFPAILTPQLRENCSEFSITSDQESWIVSIDNLATPLICILSGFLQQKFGPQRVKKNILLVYVIITSMRKVDLSKVIKEYGFDFSSLFSQCIIFYLKIIFTKKNTCINVERWIGFFFRIRLYAFRV